MLLRFTIKNYKSFKEKSVIDMVASTIKDHSDSLLFNNGINVLPIISIFGANASGKSNVFDAFLAMRSKVINSNPSFIVPYLLDEDSKNSPSEFEVCFYNKELDKEFRYGFSIKDKEVVEEWLFMKHFSKTYNLKEKCIYYREKDQKLKSDIFNSYNELDSKEINFIYSITTHNELMISNIGKRNISKYACVYNWFLNNTMLINYTYANEGFYFEKGKLLSNLYNDNRMKELVEKFINKIDPAIKKIKIKENIDERLNKSYSIYSLHKDSNNKDIYIPFQMESCGTKKVLSFAYDMIRALTNGYVLFVDELDSKLHPLLLRHVVKMFSNKEINIKGGQIIFSSHNLICLDSNDLRRDEIYFVEKENQESTIFSLYDFKETNVRNDLDFGKHYLSGRFGAVPFMKE